MLESSNDTCLICVNRLSLSGKFVPGVLSIQIESPLVLQNLNENNFINDSELAKYKLEEIILKRRKSSLFKNYIYKHFIPSSFFI